ncbi:uncharacterized protein [Eschrichtius robustus]|uniref:uncharacterized protein n=1 Tax=Eschrichtius robustus TaxID=9764 RepID=UPI0035C1C52C
MQCLWCGPLRWTKKFTLDGAGNPAVTQENLVPPPAPSPPGPARPLPTRDYRRLHGVRPLCPGGLRSARARWARASPGPCRRLAPPGASRGLAAGTPDSGPPTLGLSFHIHKPGRSLSGGRVSGLLPKAKRTPSLGLFPSEVCGNTSSNRSLCPFLETRFQGCSSKGNLRFCGGTCVQIGSLHMGMWDRSSRTRDQTHTRCIGRRSLNHWTARNCSVSRLCEVCPSVWKKAVQAMFFPSNRKNQSQQSEKFVLRSWKFT